MNSPAALRALALCSALTAVLLAGCTDSEDPGPTAPEGRTAGEDTAGTEDSSAATDDAGQTGDATDATGDAAAQTGDAADATGDAAEQTAEPVLVSGADGTFTVAAPEGWEEVTDTVEEEFQLALRDQRMRDDFFANIIVDQASPIEDMEEAIEQSATDLAGARGSYELRRELDLDGEAALGYAVTRPHEDGDRFFIQRWVEREDRLYLITLTTVASQQDEGTAALAGVLDSWAWQD